MPTPQQPELRRSGDNAVRPGGPDDKVAAPSKPEVGGETGPVPEDNLPGHHPPDEQDKPDPEEFVARAKQQKEKASAGAAEASTGTTSTGTRRGDAEPGSTGGGAHPLVTVAKIPWKLASIPVRMAIDVAGKLRRLL